MCIANLVVPVGATIYAGDYYEVHHKDMASSKFRVSSAVCHSIATIFDKQQQQVGYSNYSRFFKYDVNPKLAEQTKNSLHTEEKLFSKTVKPKGFIIPDRFSHADKVCDGGIHIFFSLRTAIRYNFS